MNMYYAPASLYWDLKRRPETNFIKYEGAQRAMSILCLSSPNERQTQRAMSKLAK